MIDITNGAKNVEHHSSGFGFYHPQPAGPEEGINSADVQPIFHAVSLNQYPVLGEYRRLAELQLRERNQINSYYALRARLFGFMRNNNPNPSRFHNARSVEIVYYILQSCPWCDAPCYQSTPSMVHPCADCAGH